MCGICGYLHFEKERPSSIETVKRMADTLVHRGPDSEGYYVNKNIALGNRRLSIIDLVSGDQPMFNSDRSVVVVVDGEIYNFIELREELKTYGCEFKTSSDTEVILKSYEKWGMNCLNRFNGAWAIAIWDEKKKQLLLTRDRMGEKPLYYSVYNNTMVFASEIKALFAFGVPRQPDLSLTELYFGLKSIPAPNTFYKNIYQLEPAHFLQICNGSIKNNVFWQLPEIDEKNMVRNKKEIYGKFEFLLSDAVKIRMRSDVPFGAFLSGGLDSSSVVSLMSGLTSNPVNTFNIRFKNPQYDESRLALIVSEKFHTQHFTDTVTPDDFDAVLERVLFHYDGPFGDSSAIPTSQVSKFASQKVKMVLTGDGGDEVLSGYVSYQGIKLTQYYNKLPSFVRKNFVSLVKLFSGCVKGDIRFRIDKIINAAQIAGLDFDKRMLEKLPTTELRKIKKMIPRSDELITLEDYFSQLMSACPYKDDFYRLMYFNLKHSLSDDMLTKVDRMSMASSLGVRIPFLDHRLVEFMVMVDKKVKMPGLERKDILKKTIGKRLPKPLLKAPKKGFGIPLLDWFNLPQFNERLTILQKSDNGLNNNIITELIFENANRIKNNGNILWMLFLYDAWIHNRG